MFIYVFSAYVFTQKNEELDVAVALYTCVQKVLDGISAYTTCQIFSGVLQSLQENYRIVSRPNLRGFLPVP
jgi:hypothetical protein